MRRVALVMRQLQHTRQAPTIEAQVISVVDTPAVPAARDRRPARYSQEPVASVALRGASLVVMIAVIICGLAMMFGLMIATPALIAAGLPIWAPMLGVISIFGGLVVLAISTMDLAD